MRISAREKGEQSDTTSELFEGMQRRGLEPNTLISACEKGEQPEKAL